MNNLETTNTSSKNINMIEAIKMALRRAMLEKPNVILLGQDVGLNGGVFRATEGLHKEFGPERVFDTPLAESLIMGLSVGMSTQGLIPVAEIQFFGFIYPAANQLINHAAKMRNRTRGRLHCPIVVRTPCGAGIRAPEHHGESIEAIFAHVPGIKIVVPSSPKMAYGLLLDAINDPDPVLFLESTRLYRISKQDVIDDGKSIKIGKADIMKSGRDITVVSYGAALIETIQAVRSIEKDKSINVELIDLCTIKPLDMETILNSVKKTGRCLIVHEAARTCGIGAEIVANIAENIMLYLKAPVKRVTGYDAHIPYFKLENDYMPSVDRIYSAINEVVSYL